MTLSLRELHLKRTRVDSGQQIAFAHELAFAERDVHQLAVHAAPNRDVFKAVTVPRPVR